MTSRTTVTDKLISDMCRYVPRPSWVVPCGTPAQQEKPIVLEAKKRSYMLRTLIRLVTCRVGCGKRGVAHQWAQEPGARSPMAAHLIVRECGSRGRHCLTAGQHSLLMPNSVCSTWKYRFFRLDGAVLSYYTSPEDTSALWHGYLLDDQAASTT